VGVGKRADFEVRCRRNTAEALEERNVEPPWNFAAEPVIAVVFGNAHDLESGPRIREFISDVLTDWVLFPKKEPCHGFVDDADARRGLDVLRPDLAAQEHGNADSGKVIWADL